MSTEVIWKSWTGDGRKIGVTDYKYPEVETRCVDIHD